MRVDANVSVRRVGDAELGTRCEIKNLNSLRSLGRAIEYEAARQIDLLEAGERVRQETRHWDEDDGRTHSLRSKEEADDYRYFPEPDLVPLEPDDDVDQPSRRRPLPDAARGPPRRRSRPPPASRRRRCALPSRWSATSTSSRSAAIEAGADPDRVLTHVEHNLAVDGAAARSTRRARRSSSRLEVDGQAHRHPGQGRARRDGRRRGRDPADDREGARASRRWTTAALERLVDDVIAAHPDEWERYRRRRRQGAGQAHRLLRRQGHEGDEGQGRRQGRHRPPPRARGELGVVDERLSQPFEAASSLIAPESERRFAHAAT